MSKKSKARKPKHYRKPIVWAGDPSKSRRSNMTFEWNEPDTAFKFEGDVLGVVVSMTATHPDHPGVFGVVSRCVPELVVYSDEARGPWLMGVLHQAAVLAAQICAGKIAGTWGGTQAECVDMAEACEAA